jgi:small-conductance mechanosensitive channel
VASFTQTLLQVLPCSLSVTTYHLFQLTEVSTVFLHLAWMASKSLVQYYTLFAVSLALLATFAVRVVTSAYIVFHVITRLLDLELWAVRFPHCACMFHDVRAPNQRCGAAVIGTASRHKEHLDAT